MKCIECSSNINMKDVVNKVKCNECLTVFTVETHGKKRKLIPVTSKVSSYHHWDRNKLESTVSEYEINLNAKVVNTNSVICGICSNPSDSIKAITGSLLRSSSRTFHDTEIDPITHDEVPIERKIKFPTYLACSICSDCVSYFTILCSELDSKFRVPKAKFRFVELPKQSRDSNIRFETIDVSPNLDTPDDCVSEIEDFECETESVIHAVPAHTLPSRKIGKAAKLEPNPISAKAKPSKFGVYVKELIRHRE